MRDVARENREMTLKAVGELFRKRRADILLKVCKNYVKHVKHVEKSHWKTDRIMGAKLDIYSIPKINMLHNLSCLNTRFRLLCR